ncbi:predicted protein [Arabidopsis lyrata subsp. lyrata]|uniref:Predicted protein n=1 Tax=Arabidopsis lyrata subsp. lyrata TaxID=81972 RepID=D7M7K6_ARALL|nr:predicted protein [Arabidopsis lyrata subsp. lyrata]
MSPRHKWAKADYEGVREVGYYDLKFKTQTLDLSHNNLSGEIPQTLSKLRELNVLELRNNKLTGRIPQSPQLDRLNDPDIYSNNNKLCGMQIQEPCSTQTKQPEENKEEAMFSWKAAVIGCPCGFSNGSCLNVYGWLFQRFSSPPPRRPLKNRGLKKSKTLFS